MTKINCEEYKCKNNKDGVCQAGEIRIYPHLGITYLTCHNNTNKDIQY
jgi:hypothetical protein